MSKHVTFDYSKTGSFISQEEIGYMKKLALDAKEVLVSSLDEKTEVKCMISVQKG